MATNIGLQALLNNDLDRKPVQFGLGEPLPPSNTFPIKFSTPLFSPSSSLLFSFISIWPLPTSNGGEDTKSSFRLCLCTKLLPLSFSFSFLLSGNGSERRGHRRELLRLRSIRKVDFRRRRVTRGEVLGLLVGLWATPHWVASSLNLCNVAIFEVWQLLSRLLIGNLILQF